MSKSKSPLPVASVAEWLALPELSIPVVASEADKGTIFMVHKVGFLFVNTADCRAAKLDSPSVADGKSALPTASVDFAGKVTLCRLPTALAEWAFSCVALAQQGIRSFPGKVEFGVLRGRAYAERL
ncbi:hypothetical protein [Ralstonia pseudosolanacearum]|uniref:hypothetical protein n=1 Tax=Ralstonia pseudosolanacearum TaxID=1310165 RepID=UPI003CF36EEB